MLEIININKICNNDNNVNLRFQDEAWDSFDDCKVGRINRYKLKKLNKFKYLVYKNYKTNKQIVHMHVCKKRELKSETLKQDTGIVNRKTGKRNMSEY